MGCCKSLKGCLDKDICDYLNCDKLMDCCCACKGVGKGKSKSKKVNLRKVNQNKVLISFASLLSNSLL